LEERQLGIPDLSPQVPLVRSQNWFTGQKLLSRQKKLHWPFTHEFFGTQSPSSRHPARHCSNAVLQMLLSGQCSSSVHGPVGMHFVVVVSQNVPLGQSRFEVHDANDWQYPSALQKLFTGQPAVPVHLHEPLAMSHTWFAGQLALPVHTQRLSGPRMKPGGQQLAPTHTQAASAESYAYPEGQHSVFEQTQSPLRAS
jgi:hypothetical protein